jgi:predicted transcriptional regulator
MKIQVSAEEERALKVAMALSSDKRLRIVSLLREKPMSLAEIHRRINGSKYTSTTFRDLEILVKADLAEKFYEEGVKYRLKSRQIVFTI